MTNTIRIVAEDGTTTLVTLRPANPAGTDPVIVQTHELTMAAPRVVDQVRSGRSGRDDFTAYHDSAQFKATVLVQDDGSGNTRHDYVDLLRGLAAAHRRPWLYIQRDGWLTERRALLRGDPAVAVVDRDAWRFVQVSLQFAIPDGCLEDIAGQSAVIRPLAVTTGMSFPMTYPLAFAAGAIGSSTFVTSNGNVPTPPRMRVYGTFTDPTITNLTTGQQIKFSGVTVPAGQYLDVDVDARTVYLNGDPSLSYYSKLDFTTSTWWELQPGVNAVTVTTSSQDASCELDLFWTDRWM